MLPKTLRGRLLLSLLIGLAVLIGLMLYADLPKMVHALGEFEWRYLPAILALVLYNYALRFVKWHFYLGQIGVTAISRRDSLLIFLSGLSMTVTPGRVGEWLKSYFLTETTSTPFSRSAPIIIAERLTDALSMVLIACTGLFLFGFGQPLPFGKGWPIVVSVLALAAGVVAVVWFHPFARRALALAERLPLLSRRVGPIRQFYQSSHILLSPKNLLLATALGVVSWTGEAVAFYLVLLGLGLEGSGLLVVQALFIYASASLAGIVFLTPGGLGVAEGGIIGLCQALLNMAREGAAAATLLIRLSTLWFGVAVGVGALVLITRRLGVTPEPSQT